MFAKILGILPGWVWVVLAIAIALLGGAWVLHKIETQATQLQESKDANLELIKTNKTQEDTINELRRDQLARAQTNKNIAEKTEGVNDTYNNYDAQLREAIAKRNALQVAVNASTAVEQAPVVTPTPTSTNTVKPSVTPQEKPQPKVTQQDIDNDAVEVDIAWAAYCKDNPSTQCQEKQP